MHSLEGKHEVARLQLLQGQAPAVRPSIVYQHLRRPRVPRCALACACMRARACIRAARLCGAVRAMRPLHRASKCPAPLPPLLCMHARNALEAPGWTPAASPADRPALTSTWLVHPLTPAAHCATLSGCEVSRSSSRSRGFLDCSSCNPAASDVLRAVAMTVLSRASNFWTSPNPIPLLPPVMTTVLPVMGGMIRAAGRPVLRSLHC